jgi:uncharacterized alkaline shock family protein YloU
MSLVREEARGTVTVTASTLAALVTRAAEGVEGVRVRRGRRHLDVDVEGERARVAVALTARFGLVLPDTAREVQVRIRDALGTMCGVDAAPIDVTVEDVE